jgi:chemotaxis protein MotB
MNYKRTLVYLIACCFLGSCVSQQKYNALLQARDNLELKATEYSIALSQERTKAINYSKRNQELGREMAQVNLDNQRVNRELDRLRSDETELVFQHGQLASKYEDIQDYFEIILEDCDKDKIEIARKDRRLQIKEDSLLKVLIDLRLLEETIRERANSVVALSHYDSTSINAIYNNMSIELGSLISTGFRILKMPNRVQISIDETVIFEPGGLEVTDQGTEVLGHVAIALNAQPNIEVLVMGHTDKVKIVKKARYLNDNWDLSVLKASAVTRALTESKLDPSIVTASGRAAYDPMVSNQTEAGRDKNKRMEINIYPKVMEEVRLNMNR